VETVGGMVPYGYQKCASMEPRLLRRGNMKWQERCDGGLVASMEPRLLRRGNLVIVEPPGIGMVGASMEPRLLRRGN